MSEIKEFLKDLIEMAEEGYKLHIRNACHVEFLSEDRECLSKAKAFLKELNMPPSTNNQREGEKGVEMIDKFKEARRALIHCRSSEALKIIDDVIIRLEETDAPVAQPMKVGMDLSNGPDKVAYLKYKDGYPIPITKEEFEAAQPTETPSLPVDQVSICHAVQWDATNRAFEAIKKLGVMWKPGPMGGKTFLIEIGDAYQIVEVGDWVIRLPLKEGQAIPGTYNSWKETHEWPDFVIGRIPKADDKALPVEEVPKMRDELAAMADITAIEYGKEHGTSGASFSYDNSGDLTNAHEAGQSWMYREMQKELSSLCTQLSDTKRELERQASLKNSALATIEDQKRRNTSLESRLSEAQKDRDAYKNQAAELRELIVGQAHKSQD